MKSGQITVVARFRAQAGMEELLRKELLALIEPSRADDGCINYDLHQGVGDPALFVFHENWQSKEHLDRHSATAHVQAFRSKAPKLLDGTPELILLEMISSRA